MIHFGKDIRNTGQTPPPSDYEGTETDWHEDATADTGTSHAIPGRGFLVLCEWCEDAFFARTKTEAMALFRDHESKMLGIVEHSA